ncbi:MAG: cytochrome c [Anderseniella sp.]
MMSRFKLAAGTLIIGLATATALTTAALADPITDRQAAMKNVGKAMGALAAIAKKEAPFDAAVVAENATAIANNVKAAKDLYPDGSDTGEKETWAKAEIWANKDDFAAKHDKSVEAAMAMAAVTEEANFGAALGALGGTCKACHETYRRPKE